MAIRFLSGSVTQGSADAFATASMATGLANLSLGYRVRRLVYALPSPVEVDSDVTMQLVRRTPTALLGLNDRTLINTFTRNVKITTSGQMIYDQVIEIDYSRDFDLLIVEDPIFLSIDSSTTSAANVGAVRVFYEEVRLSETAKLAALTESLNA